MFLVALNQPNTCKLDLYFHNYHSIKTLCNIYFVLLWFGFFAHFDGIHSFQVAKSVDQSLDTYARKTIKDINEYFLDFHGLLQVIEQELLLSVENKFQPMCEDIRKGISVLENSSKLLNVSCFFNYYIEYDLT